jgi:hypothetical protein
MARCLKPGGVLAVEDCDFTGHFAIHHCPRLIGTLSFAVK